jgi:hypothetical protein
MRDEFYRQYNAEMLEICDVPGMRSTSNNAALFQN